MIRNSTGALYLAPLLAVSLACVTRPRCGSLLEYLAVGLHAANTKADAATISVLRIICCIGPAVKVS